MHHSLCRSCQKSSVVGLGEGLWWETASSSANSSGNTSGSGPGSGTTSPAEVGGTAQPGAAQGVGTSPTDPGSVSTSKVASTESPTSVVGNGRAAGTGSLPSSATEGDQPAASSKVDGEGLVVRTLNSVEIAILNDLGYTMASAQTSSGATA